MRVAAFSSGPLAYIDERSPTGAHRVEIRIRDVMLLLSEHPAAGALTSRRRLRRIIVPPILV